MNQDALQLARWTIEAGEAFSRLQFESLRASLEDTERNLRAALEAPSPDRLIRMRGEMLAAESRRMLELAQRYAELALRQREELGALLAKLGGKMGGNFSVPEPFARMLEAARSVEEGMAALARQSTGMWEAQLRASKQAIEQALAGSGGGARPEA